MNNNNNNMNHHHLQALAAALGSHQHQQTTQASVVSESVGNNNSSDQRSGDSNSRTSDSSNSSDRHNNSVSSRNQQQQQQQPQQPQQQRTQQLIQPLVDAASASSQGTNLLAGLDVATQALLLKALQNQAGVTQPPASNSNNNSNLTAQQLLVQQIQRLQQQQQQQQRQQQSSAGGPAAVNPQAAAHAMLAAALAGRSAAAAAPPPPKPHVIAPPPPVHQVVHASGRATSSSRPRTVEASSSIKGADTLDKNKRVANRISAQQSRLRKKQYVEELKGENDELRKLRQIMAVVPDVILAFDSSGVIQFLTNASEDFFGATPEQLTGTSIWDILCTKSVRRLKAAFMDSLANRTPDQDSVSLGKRIWEIRMKDQDPTTPSLSLHGAVHFGAGAPECVCLVRRMSGKGASTTIPTEVAPDEERQSETTSDHTSSEDADGDAGAADSPQASSEETGAAASTEVKPPSVVQAADYNGGDDKKQGPFDTSSSMSSGSS